MQPFRSSLKAFLADESGVLLAEALIMLPILIWGFIALVVYWDVFRTINVTQKAAYSISDLLSRQEVVTPSFVDGLQNILTFLTPGAPDSRMRITSFEYNATEDRYILLFSRSPDGRIPALTEDELQDLRDRIPAMDNMNAAILVETWVEYQPDFDIGILGVAPGLGDQTFTQFVVTQPRRRRVCLEGSTTCV